MFAILLFSIPCLSIYSFAFPIPDESNDRPIIGKFILIINSDIVVKLTLFAKFVQRPQYWFLTAP